MRDSAGAVSVMACWPTAINAESSQQPARPCSAAVEIRDAPVATTMLGQVWTRGSPYWLKSWVLWKCTEEFKGRVSLRRRYEHGAVPVTCGFSREAIKFFDPHLVITLERTGGA
ncbi:hypothetical protein C8R44DRAFT_739272 [Mycena epipterygia]|nr:hypothetical protein C8R44DRAFT_739272 [Mycena epipterygia]